MTVFFCTVNPAGTEVFFLSLKGKKGRQWRDRGLLHRLPGAGRGGGAARRGPELAPQTQKAQPLVLVGAGGLAYEEAAEVCGCAVGTIKSRVSRARKAVAELLDNNTASYSGDDSIRSEEAFDDIMKQAAAISAANGN